ncbi:MAG TPA: type I polyketide synthase [Actinocrinis sp.]|nr:type I polyketide synthase [Actinocrinis sp.]
MVDHTAARRADPASGSLSGPVREPIAIVGIGCRLPARLDGPAALWRALRDGVDAVREVPADRWNAAAWADAQSSGTTAHSRGGFLDDATGFDAEFFGIRPAEARQTDPQQRIALEVAHAAVEDSRRGAASLSGSRTGVFIGAMWQEYAQFTGGSAEAIHAHSAIGWDNSVIASRIAYALGLRGPAMTVATASSSSLVAVHLAVQSLRSGESDYALAGGVSLMLHPNTSVAMTKLGTQSPDGRCRAFDADADGYVRGEGCALVVLRRLSDAVADGDRIYALVHGSAVNNDGATDGLTAPSLEAQVEVLRSAWENAGVAPAAAAYSEAHGTGTALGDVVEAGALGRVFGRGRSAPLRIGSAKTNFGHLEPAAGVLGLVKVALSLHHGRIPPSLHLRTPNPRIDFAAGGLDVVTADTGWPEGPRFAGVSSFGFGGTNAHVALGQAPAAEQTPDPQNGDGPVCLVVSGLTGRALAHNARRLADHLANSPEARLADIAHSLATTRTQHSTRGAVVAGSTSEAVRGLRALAADESHDAVVAGAVAECGRVVFVFPGQGAQWWAMGRSLWEQSEAFREAVTACDEALAQHTGWSVAALVRGEDTDASFARADVVQPALFAMYVGLAAMWRAWGVEPSAVVGHSQGEVAAAVVSGALTLEDGARVVALRGRAVHEHAADGAMGLVERPVGEVRERLAPYGDSLSVAVVNTERSTVVAGDAEAVDRFLAQMEAAGAYCQKVDVNYASHSPHMDPLLPGLRGKLAGISPTDADIAFYSSVTGQRLSGPELDADYWCRNLREPVRFDQALERLQADGFGVFVEVSPHPVLAVALAQGTAADDSAVVVGSLRRDRGGVDQALRALAELHVRGYPVEWERALPARGAHTVDLPTYAFQHHHYWLDDPAEAGQPGDGPSWRDEVSALPERERLPWLVELVRREAGSLLGRPADGLRSGTALREQGFDSVTVVELRNRLTARTRITLPTALAFDYPTPHAIATLLLAHAGAQPQVPAIGAPVSPRSGDDPIAIVSMACRLPDGIDTPEAFWDLLADGREASGPFPQRWHRWDLTTLDDAERDATGRQFVRRGGFVREVEDFDAAFFGLNAREALSLEPQQRLALEVAWEALERANLRPGDLAGGITGVYLGAMSSDYDVARRWDVDSIDGYKVTGNASSLISGRVSYTMGLSGPALTVDTACSSSLVALRLACAALSSGECDLALAGGVTVMSTPQIFVEFSRLNGLAGDGRCKSFADDADGTSWAEGCGVLVLKRLSDAERDGDRVLALVRGAAVNQDGRSQGLTAPNGLAQQRVVRAALSEAGLTPADIDVVEAHATGTVLGDPIEVGALAAVFAGRERPLYLGSAKSNIGHAQAASGVIGVIKMVLALQHQSLPRTLHTEHPSTRIDWAGSELELLHQAQPWPRARRVRRAGISSFGISGTNAHVILEEPPAAVAADQAGDDLAYPLVISGVDEAALNAQARLWAGWLAARPSGPVRDIAYTSAVGRTHYDARAVILATDTADAAEGMRSVEPGGGVVRGRVAFVFPGQGAQWAGMGRELLEHSAVFRGAVAQCDAVLLPLTGWSVLDVLRGEQGVVDDVSRVDVVQCALFAMYVGLAAVWRGWGVEPSAVVGHSQGEVAAAVVCGALSVEAGARVVALRTQALVKHAVGGAMGLVERPVDEVRELIASYGDALSVAVVNSPRSTVVAGDEDAVTHFLAQMEELGGFCQRVGVDYASHSARMDVLLPGLREGMSGVDAGRATVPFYSSVTGEILAGPELDGEYWCRNLREPVRFDRALDRLRSDGFAVFVEVSPHPVLGTVLSQACEGDDSAVVVGSLQRGSGGVDRLWRSVGTLFVRGFPVDWETVLNGRGARKVDVPTYAFQRRRFWFDEPSPAPTSVTSGQLPAEHPWLGAMTTLAGTDGYLFTGRLSLDGQPWLADHVVGGSIFVPGAGLLDVALWAARAAGADALADVTLLEPVVLPQSGGLRIQATIGDADTHGRRPFALYSQPDDTDEPRTWQQHITGECVARSEAADRTPPEDLTTWPVPGAAVIDSQSFYTRALANGLAYGPAFQCLRELSCRDGIYYGRVSLSDSLEPAGHGLHPALFDAVLQVVVAGLLESSAGSGPLVPFIWPDVELYRAAGRELWVRVEFESGGDGDGLAPATVWLADSAGPVARVGRLRFQRGGRSGKRHSEHLYRIGFEPAQLLDEAPDLDGTMVLGDAELGAALGVDVVPDLDALFTRPDSGLQAPRRLLFTTPGATSAQRYDAEQDAVDALRSLQSGLGDARIQGAELVWVTRDAVSTGSDDEVRNWADAAVWGMVRVARTEQPERVLRLMDLGPGPVDVPLFARALGTVDEPECVLRGVTALVPRARPTGGADDALILPDDGCWQLQQGNHGQVDAVAVVRPEGAPDPLDPREVRVDVRAAGISSQGTCNVLEFAGVVKEIGTDVASVHPGDRVMGIASGPLGNETRVDQAALKPIPGRLGFAQAVAVLGERSPAVGRADPPGTAIGHSGLGFLAPANPGSPVPPDPGSPNLPPFAAYDVRHVTQALRHAQQNPAEKVVVTVPRPLDPDGTVLITGGLGELGSVLAAHLVRVHGVRRLVLFSRRAGSGPETGSFMRDLEAAGAEQVDLVAGDVADRAAVAAAVDGVDPEHPLTAVFHLAGVLDDGLVQGFSEDRLRRVMAPKVQGARHLDELTRHTDLAAFVLFSSAAGTLGTAGQSGYAAANATLDALAANRRKQGVPGLSLAFGLWQQSGVGMTAHLGKAELGRLRRQGIGVLTLDEGLGALDAALARPEPYLVPVHLELASLRHALGDAQVPALLRAMVHRDTRAQQADTPEAGQSLGERLADASEAERLAVLLDLVRGEAAAVLGLPGPDSLPGDKTLRSLGIDSLTMIELRKRLAKRTSVALPATLVYDYPTAEAIAGLLLRDVTT